MSTPRNPMRVTPLLLAAAATMVMMGCGGPAKNSAAKSSFADDEFVGDPPPNAVVTPKPLKLTSSGKVVDQDALNQATDPCAENLEDINGAILEYYATAGHLPNSLHDLQAFSSEQLNLTCPTSHEPYVYRAVKMVRGSDTRELILYDSTAVHKGIRWGVIALSPKGKRPLQLDVVPLTEEQVHALLDTVHFKPAQ